MLTVISGPDSRAPVSLSDKLDFSKSLTRDPLKISKYHGVSILMGFL